MYQIDNSSVAPLLPASTALGTVGFFTDGNPATGTAPTIVPAEFLNMLMLEVLGVLSVAGVAPSKSNFTQLATAIRAINRQAVILADTGTAGAYAAANSPALTALPATGYAQWINIAHPNPGAATYSPDGLAAKPIYGLGLQALQGGELPVGLACFRYLVQAGVNGGNGAWVVIESLGGSPQIASGTASSHAATIGQLQSGYGSFAIDTGTANTYVCSFTPAITARAEGQPLRFKAKTANNGACTINDGFGVVPFVGGAHAALQGGEIVANGDCWIQWNSSVGSGSYILLFCTGAAEQIANGTQSQHAVALGQLATPIGTTAPQFDNSLKFVTTAFVQAMGLQFSTILAPTVSTTLTAAMAAGALVVGNSGVTAINVALPATTAMPVGKTITFWNYASGNMTLNCNGTDNILMPASVAFITLHQGDSITLASTSGGLWYAVGGSLQAAYSQAYGSNLGASGWKRTPDASSPTGYMLEQWGSAGSAAAGSLVNVTFPIAFSAILVSHANPIGSAVNSNAGGGIGVNRSTTGLTLYNWGGAIAYSMYWYVKGY